jgi:hypothetical protein
MDGQGNPAAGLSGTNGNNGQFLIVNADPGAPATITAQAGGYTASTTVPYLFADGITWLSVMFSAPGTPNNPTPAGCPYGDDDDDTTPSDDDDDSSPVDDDTVPFDDDIWSIDDDSWSVDDDSWSADDDSWSVDDDSWSADDDSSTICWSPMSSGTSANLLGVWGSASSDVFAVGYDDSANLAVILHYDGASWSAMTSGITDDVLLPGVWGSASSDVFAVGIDNSAGAGVIFHYDGSSWSPMTTGTTDDVTLSGVWGSSSSDVFAVGDFDTFLHYDGASWSAMTDGTSANLFGVWGSSPSDVFAVGTDSSWAVGAISHYDGSSWSPMTIGTTGALRRAWGSSSSDVFAAGAAGTILHYDGSSWSSMTRKATIDLNGVWGASSSDVFAAGGYSFGSGVLAHYNGSSWSAATNGLTAEMYGVWEGSASAVFAVGQNGTILQPGGCNGDDDDDTSPDDDDDDNDDNDDAGGDDSAGDDTVDDDSADDDTIDDDSTDDDTAPDDDTTPDDDTMPGGDTSPDDDTTVIVLDDGQADDGFYHWLKTQGGVIPDLPWQVVQSFTAPYYPAVLEAAKIYIANPGVDPVRLVVYYGPEGPSSQPGPDQTKIIYRSEAATTTSGWNNFDLTGVPDLRDNPIAAGRFYVGFEYDAGTGSPPDIGWDRGGGPDEVIRYWSLVWVDFPGGYGALMVEPTIGAADDDDDNDDDNDAADVWPEIVWPESGVSWVTGTEEYTWDERFAAFPLVADVNVAFCEHNSRLLYYRGRDGETSAGKISIQLSWNNGFDGGHFPDNTRLWVNTAVVPGPPQVLTGIDINPIEIDLGQHPDWVWNALNNCECGDAEQFCGISLRVAIPGEDASKFVRTPGRLMFGFSAEVTDGAGNTSGMEWEPPASFDMVIDEPTPVPPPPPPGGNGGNPGGGGTDPGACDPSATDCLTALANPCVTAAFCDVTVCAATAWKECDVFCGSGDRGGICIPAWNGECWPPCQQL